MVAKMQTFAQSIDERVRTSSAHSNSFFENCEDSSKRARLENVAEMVINWYFVTKHFGLSAPVYTGVLARELRNAEGKKSKLLQYLLVESAMISGDDLGLGHEQLYNEHGGSQIPHNERIHYKLWGDMTEKIIAQCKDKKIKSNQINGLNIEGAQARGLVQPETVKLVRKIEEEFSTIEGGASIYQTVESIAYNIVVAYGNLIKRVDNISLTDRDLVYLEIHKPLEKEHDVQSTSIIELVDRYFDGKYRTKIRTKVKETSELFGDFWRAMDEIVFKN